MRFAYPFVTEADEDGRVLLHFPDVPGAQTDGADAKEAVAGAEDVLLAALGGHVEARRPVPPPSPARGRPVVVLPPLAAAKLALHAAMLEDGVSNSELGRRLGVTESIIRRLLDLDHRSHIGNVGAALAALGREIEVQVRRAA